MKCDLILKAGADTASCDFWKYFSEEKKKKKTHASRNEVGTYITALFGNTYLCEATFSTKKCCENQNKEPTYQWTLTRVAVINYEVDHMELTEVKGKEGED